MNSSAHFFDSAWQIYQVSDQGDETLAIENSLIRYLPQFHLDHPDQTPQRIMHWYPIPEPTILLGAKDTRLPQIQEGVHYLQSQGYKVVVRPHGGMAIVCDPGVINFSLVQDMAHYPLSIDDAYEEFISWLRHVFDVYGLPVDAYEMVHSYCPGKFDVIINGKKIGGTAQRRFKTGVTTAAYLSLSGDQSQRAQLLKDFYAISGADHTYPSIDVDCMTTLSDQYHHPVSVENFYHTLTEQLQVKRQATYMERLPKELEDTYHAMLTQIQDRTHRLTQSQ